MRVDGWEETAAPSPRGIRSSVINLVEKTHARTRTDATYRRGNASLPVCAQRILGSRDLGDPFRSLSLFLSLLSRSVRTSVLSARVQPWPEEEESRCKTRGGRGGDPPLPFPQALDLSSPSRGAPRVRRQRGRHDLCTPCRGECHRLLDASVLT